MNPEDVYETAVQRWGAPGLKWPPLPPSRIFVGMVYSDVPSDLARMSGLVVVHIIGSVCDEWPDMSPAEFVRVVFPCERPFIGEHMATVESTVRDMLEQRKEMMN